MRKSEKNSQNTRICSSASMESTRCRNSQELIKTASCTLFSGTCLVWMLTQFATRMDLVALANNAGHIWYFQNIMAWMRDNRPNLTAVSVQAAAYSLQLIDTDPNVDDLPHTSTAHYDWHSPCFVPLLSSQTRSFRLRSAHFFATALALAPLYATNFLCCNRALAINLSTLGFFRFLSLRLERPGIHGNR